MSETTVEAALNDCDREPIHIPGSIQPHGIMLVLDDDVSTVVQGAGGVERLTGRDDWVGARLETLLTPEIAEAVASLERPEGLSYAGRWQAADGVWHDVTTHLAGGRRVVEAERSSQAPETGIALLSRLDHAAAAFERAGNVRSLAARAAEEFRELTGFDRVMIYRFLDDEAGSVLAEARAEGMASFLNHHFPATDIPRQARALYVRNTVRVIPDVGYEPAPLRPALAGPPLDMSDSVLRSVSPVHMQYMRNMGVGASASISIVTDGMLWGLIACHHATPKLMTHEVRIAAAALARGLARQLKAKDEADIYRERVRLRGLEDELLARIPLEEPLEASLAANLQQTVDLVQANGAAVMRGKTVRSGGVCPPGDAIVALGKWLARTAAGRVVTTNSLAEIYPAAEAWSAEASGLMAFVISAEEPFVVMWFRAETVEVVRWAGDPHAAVKTGPSGKLTPRASFEDWTETVRGKARRWSTPEIETAARFREALFDLRSMRQMRAVNMSLQETVADKDLRLEHQDFLLREVNHRVQNSLSLIASFLALQARDNGGGQSPGEVLKEAQRRVKAVSLVHSRLYKADQFETIDLGRYFGELIEDMGLSSGVEWASHIQTELAPISVPAQRAVTYGLVLTELMINAQKYAYGGKPGPLGIVLEQVRGTIRLIVTDQGVGQGETGKGFGSRMIESLAGQLGATVEYQKARPGLRVVLSGPAA
ncbi:light-regulated signal transduction histidine kinase (bacteriophytochrome) [Brevundimonas alba]|uniref:Light-regulated signal transduction histidine kinase (Bacteriophytochrome) n=1 Tax=Brevundimonas alba TaxID=74314 RepID=A0A7X5YIF4_9CAUL|nr:light-regulated signal transduction histidine kinase (bacteriophytochrome) [Brevundimonas alba]